MRATDRGERAGFSVTGRGSVGKSIVGLDIGTSAIRAAEISGGHPPTLVRFAQVSLPAGAVADGEVVDRRAVTDALKDLWRRGGFRAKRVATSVANQKVVVRQVDLPWMEEEELRGALRYQVQEYIPIPIEDAVLDYQVLEEFAATDDARMVRVLVVAALRDMVGEFVGAVEDAGLHPDLIDYSGFAALRALAEPESGVFAAREAEAVLDIGAGVTNILVHEGGIPRFVRILQAGGSDITEALVAALGVGAEEGERLKVSTVASNGAPVEGPTRIIEQRLASFVDDVRSSVEYYQAQPGAAPLSRVLIVGGGSRLPRLADRLAQALRLPVEEGRPLATVKLGRLGLDVGQLSQVSAVAAVAVGLALEDR
ncbi:MAG: type IV pilus assembly protein PilM [Acidobacteria bacterium]|nr:type IV pilus assembly protein PilM [Acidobacteriota bacterium]